MIPEILATLACGIFAGAAIYVNLVEQPARLSCGIALAITEWRPSYQRGTVMQASLAFIGSVLAFFSAWLSRDPAWIVGGALRVFGVADADGRPLTVSPDADRTIMRSGTGGLY